MIAGSSPAMTNGEKPRATWESRVSRLCGVDRRRRMGLESHERLAIAAESAHVKRPARRPICATKRDGKSGGTRDMAVSPKRPFSGRRRARRIASAAHHPARGPGLRAVEAAPDTSWSKASRAISPHPPPAAAGDRHRMRAKRPYRHEGGRHARPPARPPPSCIRARRHGDPGMITRDDGILAFSWSGETVELGNLVSYSRRLPCR